MALIAVIRSHPDKRALLAEFDAVVTGVQLHSVVHGGIVLTDTFTYDALKRFRDQVADGL
jgi:hypothetical protein